MHFFSLLRVQFIIFTVIAISILLTCPAVGTDSKTGVSALSQAPSTASGCDTSLNSIISLKKSFNTLSDWYAVVYNGDTGLFNSKCEKDEVPSKLCFRKGKDGKDEDCFPARIYSSTGDLYECWSVEEELKTILFLNKSHPQKVLLFTAQFNGGGSDWLNLITLWFYDIKTDRFRQIPVQNKSKGIVLNASDVFRLFDLNIHGPRKILVVGNNIWGENETHYGDHFYNISIYVYKPDKTFRLLVKYKTKTKYYSEDVIMDKNLLFNSEEKNIRRYLRERLR